MYRELTAHDVAHELSSNKNNGFSYQGARALAEYLEELEEDTGEKLELDTIAIRCEYDEYESALEAASEYGYTPDIDGDTDEKPALEYLEERTTVIPFTGGVIIQAF